jgi:hypothetical protein
MYILLNRSLQELLDLQPIMILKILFCNITTHNDDPPIDEIIGIISVGFDVTDQLQIRFFIAIRKPMIRLRCP